MTGFNRNDSMSTTASADRPARRLRDVYAEAERAKLASIPSGIVFRRLPNGWPYDVDPDGRYVRSYHNPRRDAAGRLSPGCLMQSAVHPDTGEELVVLSRDGETIEINPRHLAELVHRRPEEEAREALEAMVLPPERPDPASNIDSAVKFLRKVGSAARRLHRDVDQLRADRSWLDARLEEDPGEVEAMNHHLLDAYHAIGRYLFGAGARSEAPAPPGESSDISRGTRGLGHQ
jgi:hypothetical protein